MSDDSITGVYRVVRPRLPLTRGECENGERPCSHRECRYHLLPLQQERRGRPSNIPQSGETCSLDVAGRGPSTLEEVGEHFGITRERCRQIEEAALAKLKRRLGPDAIEMMAGFAAPVGQ